MEVTIRHTSMSAFAVRDTSQVGEVRRAASAAAKGAGFDETRCGRVAVVATEIATNLSAHAKDGEVFIRAVTLDGRRGIELIAVDRGPGMADVERCRRDGFSTAGTAGMGLGAISRMSDRFELQSQAGAGTVLVARVWCGAAARLWDGGGWEVGFICVPMRGETACGDGAEVVNAQGRSIVAVADGLGHGPNAAGASSAALAVLDARPELPPKEMIEEMHRALRATRGAAVAVAEVDWVRRELRFCGIGNITATLHGSGPRDQHLLSHNGIVGHTVGRVQQFTYPLAAGAVLAMNTDGLRTNRSLDGYPGILMRDLSLIAGVLYRDNRRERDDATVVVLRERERRSA